MDHKVSKDMISSGMTPSGEKTQADLGRTQYGSAPSPSKLMDAYKSMYKEENLGKDTSFPPFTKEKVYDPKASERQKFVSQLNKKTPVSGPGQGKPTVGKVKTRKVDPQTLKNNPRADVQTNSFDLLAAYRAVYEHHKKDADGNTIPHEGEEVNEGKIPAGLQAYLDKKKGKKEDKKEDKKEIKEEPISLGLLAAGAGKLLAGAGAKAAAAGATKAAAAGATKAAAAGAGKAAGSTIAKGGLTKTITRAGIKAGGKTGGRIAQSIAKDPMGALDKAADISYKAQMVGSMLPKPRPRTSGSGGGSYSGGMSSTVSAGADLFDIVKGQLLDEGLSEEEIRDIMLTLTPDEIMNEMAVNPNIAAMDAKNKADMVARAKAKEVPQNIRDASKRQMKAGTPREDPKNPYTTQDKKDIINYNKNK